MAQSAGIPVVGQYDLTPKLVSHLDRHMIFPLLEFSSAQLDEDDQDLEAKERQIVRAKYELLNKTNMTDYVADLHMQLEGLDEPPGEFADKKDKVVKQLDAFAQETSKIRELLTTDEVVNQFRADKVANLDFLKKDHGIGAEHIEALYDHANFQYSCGDYGSAAESLYQFRVLSTDNDKVQAATWGRLASEILSGNWESAMEELQKVREGIDQKLFHNPLAQLQHRTWLMHWALFPLSNYDAGREAILDLFFSPGYINTLQTNCPWVLRYLAAAVITGRDRSRNSGLHQKQLKDVVRIVRQEAYEYADPITEFVRALYVDFDFDDAQEQLRRADEVLRSDFFLAGLADAFLDAARHLITESFCKIHARIDIGDLSETLGLNQDEGEKWIVNLIRDTKLDAKIDYKEGTVVMNHPPSSVYQQVIERTKGGFFRTQVLSAAVAR